MFRVHFVIATVSFSISITITSTSIERHSRNQNGPPGQFGGASWKKASDQGNCSACFEQALPCPQPRLVGTARGLIDEPASAGLLEMDLSMWLGAGQNAKARPGSQAEACLKKLCSLIPPAEAGGKEEPAEDRLKNSSHAERLLEFVPRTSMRPFPSHTISDSRTKIVANMHDSRK